MDASPCPVAAKEPGSSEAILVRAARGAAAGGLRDGVRV